MYTYLGFSIRATALVKRQMERRLRCNQPTSYKPLVRDWLEGHLDTHMTITLAMTLTKWNHKTFAFSTQIGLKSRNRRWYVVYDPTMTRTSLIPDTPVQIGHVYWHNRCRIALQEGHV